VRGAEHRAGSRNEIRESNTRLRAGVRHNSVIMVHPQTRLNREISEFDGVLNIESVFIDIVALVKLERLAAGTCQIVRNQPSQEGAAAKGVLVSGGKVECRDPLALVLPELVISVGDLKPVPGAQDIDVEGIPAARIEVEMVEDRAIVADRMDRR